MFVLKVGVVLSGFLAFAAASSVYANDGERLCSNPNTLASLNGVLKRLVEAAGEPYKPEYAVTAKDVIVTLEETSFKSSCKYQDDNGDWQLYSVVKTDDGRVIVTVEVNTLGTVMFFDGDPK
jgi:hypothetical protein